MVGCGRGDFDVAHFEVDVGQTIERRTAWNPVRNLEFVGIRRFGGVRRHVVGRHRMNFYVTYFGTIVLRMARIRVDL